MASRGLWRATWRWCSATSTSRTRRLALQGRNEALSPSAGGGTQEVQLIPERDVYRLVMRSKMPQAGRFEGGS